MNSRGPTRISRKSCAVLLVRSGCVGVLLAATSMSIAAISEEGAQLNPRDAHAGTEREGASTDGRDSQTADAGGGTRSAEDEGVATGPGVGPSTARAESKREAKAGSETPGEVGQIRVFDFDERPLGNFESVPMHWRRASGPGFPRYSAGGFDETVGRGSPPSFRLNLEGGNVSYSYIENDIEVDSLSDFLVIAYARSQGLIHARGFISAVYVDAAGETIEESRRVSGLFGGAGAPSGWERLEVVMPDGVEGTRWLRLELWVVQRSVWADADPEGIDPIEHQDVRGTAWFDDIGVYRLPRANAHFSNPGGIVRPGRTESIHFDVRNFTRATLEAELEVKDESSRIAHAERLPISPAAGGGARVTPVTFRLPKLGVGFYRARVMLKEGAEVLVERGLEFAVLAELPEVKPSRQMGVDLGRWGGGDWRGTYELVEALGCAAAKVGIPATGPINTSEKSEYFSQLGRLLRELDRRQIETTGVIRTAEPRDAVMAEDSVREAMRNEEAWTPRLGPVVTSVGPLISNWQLGDEEVELRGGASWTGEEIETCRRQLRRYVPTTRVVAPKALLAAWEESGDVMSVYIPASFPTRSIVRHLDFLASPTDTARWLKVRTRSSEAGDGLEAAEMARRMILALALDPHRVYIDAPVRLSHEGGAAQWQPTANYAAYRTLMHRLTGKQAIGVLANDGRNVAILFSGEEGDCVALWSWAPDKDGAEHPESELSFYVGSSPVIRELSGETRPLSVDEHGQARVAARSMPVLIEGVRAPLAQLQSGFSVSPTHVEATAPRFAPRVRLQNHFGTKMSGYIDVTPPAGWDLENRTLSVELEPGEEFEREVVMTPPARQVATTRTLTLELHILTPHPADMRFEVPFTVGLADVEVRAQASWKGDVLVIEQTVSNGTSQPISFLGYCNVRGRPRSERSFLNVGAGQTARQRYVFPRAHDLSGTRGFTGVRELRGERSLDQLVDIP